jgi:hypothetical protein
MLILRITARRHGFRRAGLAHPAVPVDHPIGELTNEQIEALLAEPMLVVERVEIDEADPAIADTASGGTAETGAASKASRGKAE